jgi:hypothetical protein
MLIKAGGGLLAGGGAIAINKILPGNIAGGGVSGNQYAPAYVTSSGVFQYSGPALSGAGTAWWYGQGIYTLSLG